MTTATFTGTGRGKAGPEGQFKDAPEEDTEEDLPLVLEDAVKKPKEGKQGASKSKSNKEAIWLYAELFLGHHDGSCHGLW